MAEPMTVSIAMATFNGGKYILKQLDSIARQSRLPDELVVCDDFSTDNTVQLVEDFSKTVPFPITIIRNDRNIGFVAAFNKALEATQGELVFLCDQDDYWFENKIAYTCKIALENPSSYLFLNNAELVDGNLNPSGFFTFEQMASIGQNPMDLVLGCCMAVRRGLLKICLPIPEKFSAHDVWLQEFASYLGSKMLIPKTLQYYRRHEKNETSHIVYSLKKISKLDFTLDYYKKRFFTKKLDNMSKTAFYISLKIEALEKAIQNANADERVKLSEARNRLITQISILHNRLAIAKNGFFRRIILSSKLFVSGAYKPASSIKGFLSDVLGTHS